MEFKKGDRIVHLGLELVGTFVEKNKLKEVFAHEME